MHFLFCLKHPIEGPSIYVTYRHAVAHYWSKNRNFVFNVSCKAEFITGVMDNKNKNDAAEVFSMRVELCLRGFDADIWSHSHNHSAYFPLRRN